MLGQRFQGQVYALEEGKGCCKRTLAFLCQEFHICCQTLTLEQFPFESDLFSLFLPGQAFQLFLNLEVLLMSQF